MVFTTQDKGRKTIRVNISSTELSELSETDASIGKIKQWIKLGRERENICAHVDETIETKSALQNAQIEALHQQVQALKNTVDGFTAVMIQVAHTLTISTTAKSQFELELIHFEKISGEKLSDEKEQTYNLAKVKHSIFKQLLTRYLPNLEHRFFLTNYILQEEKNDA